MAHHAKQDDGSHRLLSSASTALVLDGAHGATFSYVSTRIERGRTSPAAAAKAWWADIMAVWASAATVDYTLYVSGARGLGRGLSS